MADNGAAINVVGDTPIIVRTNAAHGRSTGDYIAITGVTGKTKANGTWIITVIDATTFSLNFSAGGEAAYAGGGTWAVSASMPGIVYYLKLMSAETGLPLSEDINVRLQLPYFTNPTAHPIMQPDVNGVVGPINSPLSSVRDYEVASGVANAVTDPQRHIFRINLGFNTAVWHFSFTPTSNTTYTIYLAMPGIGAAAPGGVPVGVVKHPYLVEVRNKRDNAAISGAKVFNGPLHGPTQQLFDGMPVQKTTDASPTNASGVAVLLDDQSDVSVAFALKQGWSPLVAPNLAKNSTATMKLQALPTHPSDMDAALHIRFDSGSPPLSFIDGSIVWLTETETPEVTVSGPVVCTSAGHALLYCKKSREYSLHYRHPILILDGADPGDPVTIATTDQDVTQRTVTLRHSGVSLAGGNTVSIKPQRIDSLPQFYIEGAIGWLTSDAEGTVRVSGVVDTDDTGSLVFEHMADGTYYIWIAAEGFLPIVGDEVVVSGSPITTTKELTEYKHNQEGGNAPWLVATPQYNDEVWFITKRDGSSRSLIAGPMSPQGESNREGGAGIYVPLLVANENGHFLSLRQFVAAAANTAHQVVGADGFTNAKADLQLPNIVLG